MESILVEMLILDELEEDGLYKVVSRGGRKILVEFEGPRGGGA
ncbi:MAG TPA: hypothetical protein VIX91_15640 [Candidatus Acidoferrum sp.]